MWSDVLCHEDGHAEQPVSVQAGPDIMNKLLEQVIQMSMTAIPDILLFLSQPGPIASMGIDYKSIMKDEII